ncbi:MAG: efflux RND transporter periplasmic adaptor subunit [Acidobacteriota bacterium]
MRLGHVVITLIAVALAASAALFFSHPTVAPDSNRVTNPKARVMVAPVGSQTVDLEVQAVGRVLPWRQVALAPEVTGRVQGIAVKLGDRVRSGDVLLHIDDDAYRNVLRQREADLLRAQAHSQETKASLARNNRLRQRGAVSESEYEAVLAQQRAAEADLKASEAALARAQRQLADCELRAPFDGTIVERHGDAGALAGPDRSMLVLADLDTVAVEVGLTEQEALKVRAAQTAKIESSNLPGRVAEGMIDGIAESSNPSTGTYLVRIRVDNRAKPSFLGGMVVRVRIRWRRLENVLTIPAAALLDAEESPHVFLVRDGRATRVDLRVIARIGDRMGIGPADHAFAGASDTGGSDDGDGPPFLQVGDAVVVVGQSLLRGNERVEVTSRQ